MAAAGPVLGGGGQENLHVCGRQNHCADVPSVHDDVMGPGQVPLHVQQKRPYRRDGGDGGGVFGDLRPADGLGYILAAQVHVL